MKLYCVMTIAVSPLKCYDACSGGYNIDIIAPDRICGLPPNAIINTETFQTVGDLL